MTVKVDIISGFLGAGKTTMIKKLLAEEVLGDGIAIIENEFGDINIDGDRLEKAGVEIKSISSGCICCTLSGDFQRAILELISEHNPNRIIIEPTGVGMLSDIIYAINRIKKSEDIELNMAMTIVDVLEFEDYIEVFGKFFSDQIENANVIALSKTQLTDENRVNDVINSIRGLNPNASIIATPWDKLKAIDILGVSELNKNSAGDYSHDLEHHIHDHDHDHDNADDNFDYWSFETMKKYSKEDLETILKSLNRLNYGKVLRAKGSLLDNEKEWIDFDFTANNFNVVKGKVKLIGRVTVIGIELNKDLIKELFD